MFFRRRQPLTLRPELLRQARFSLNHPVLATGELPPGPARAAILVHAEEAGGRGLAIGVRSLDTGRAVIFGFDGEIRSQGDLETALDAALSFGESMGFLFDDDAVAGGGIERRRAALERWQELVAAGGAGGDGLPEPLREPAPAPSGAVPGAPPGEAEPGCAAAGDPGAEPLDELLLDDAVVEEDRSVAGPAPARGAAPEREAVAVSNALPLTKFRRRAAAPPPPAAPDPRRGGHALGRIALRKRRRQEAVSERPGLLVRILGAF